MEEIGDYELLTQWRVHTETVLDDLTKSHGLAHKVRRKILNAITTISHNVVNGMPFEDAYEEASGVICEKTAFDKEEVLEILKGGENTPKKVTFMRRLQRSGVILSPEKYRWFLNFSDEEIRALDLRYGFIKPSSNFFWSIHPDFYAALDHLNPIEGFASPFNFNARRWCSRFDEDTTFGALGNFFNVIRTEGVQEVERTKEEEISENEETEKGTLWVINPPYTYYIFNKVLEEVKWRREAFPADEYIFLLPRWRDMNTYKYIEEHGEIYPLDSREYKIYDHANSRDVYPPIEMAFGYIGTRLDMEELVKIVQVPRSP